MAPFPSKDAVHNGQRAREWGSRAVPSGRPIRRLKVARIEKTNGAISAVMKAWRVRLGSIGPVLERLPMPLAIATVPSAVAITPKKTTVAPTPAFATIRRVEIS